MAVMSAAERAACTVKVIRELSSRGINPNVSKAQARTIVDAIDQSMSDLAATINAAIPQPERGLCPTAAKAIFLRAVIEQRYLTGA